MMARRCVFLVVLAGLSAHGATYCVAPDGTPQGDGSRAKPFSIHHVLKAVTLKPGDEVVFLDGVYHLPAIGGPLSIASVGNEKAPIVYRAETRHKAILDGGTPLAGWKRAAGDAPVWELRVKTPPVGLWVDGEFLLDASSRWRRDGKQSLDEGMFAIAKPGDATGGLDEAQGPLLAIRPWGGKEPKEVYALPGTLVDLAGAFNVVDGLLIRRGICGVHVAGRCVHVYKPVGIYLDLSGLGNNAFGSFNILRNCVVRDMAGSALTSNESRFNLIEDCVVYNAGIGHGDHGIYVSQGAENLTLRRNVWWRTSGGAVHIYSGTGIDSPRNIVVERNLFGPDKRNRCFPLANRKSCAVYCWGGSRWAGGNRITHNIVFGPHDRAISMNKSCLNLVANNTLLGSDGAPLQFAATWGDVVINNVIECAPGGPDHPGGYCNEEPDLSSFRGNLLLPRGGQGKEAPVFMKDAKLAASDPFVDRAGLDFRLKAGSDAVDIGRSLHFVTDGHAGAAPDAGALELGQEMRGEKGLFPEIPAWLLAEWPLTKRGE